MKQIAIEFLTCMLMTPLSTIRHSCSVCGEHPCSGSTNSAVCLPFLGRLGCVPFSGLRPHVNSNDLLAFRMLMLDARTSKASQQHVLPPTCTRAVNIDFSGIGFRHLCTLRVREYLKCQLGGYEGHAATPLSFARLGGRGEWPSDLQESSFARMIAAVRSVVPEGVRVFEWCSWLVSRTQCGAEVSSFFKAAVSARVERVAKATCPRAP